MLEVKVVEIEEDMIEVDDRVELVEGDVNFLFDEQVIQDERLLELEQTDNQVVVELAEINENIEGNSNIFNFNF